MSPKNIYTDHLDCHMHLFVDSCRHTNLFKFVIHRICVLSVYEIFVVMSLGKNFFNLESFIQKISLLNTHCSDIV